MQPFQKITGKDWENKARQDVKTPESFKELFKRRDGMVTGPYYTTEDRRESTRQFTNRFARGSKATDEPRHWFNAPEVSASSDKQANARGLQELMGGADGLLLTASTDSDFHTLLQDILPEYLFLSVRCDSVDVMDNFRNFLDHGKFDHSSITGALSLVHGQTHETARHSLRMFKGWPGIRVLPIHLDSSTTDDPVAQIHQAACSLNTWMEQLSDEFPTELIGRNLLLEVDLGTRYFEDIIRLRALRIIMYKVLAAWGVTIAPEDIFIHGISDAWQSDNYSPEISMVKSATAAMSGILGGVQAITIRPLNAQDSMQSRIARNVSNILREESYFNKTRDAAGGSYYIESMTDKVARRVWEKIQSA